MKFPSRAIKIWAVAAFLGGFLAFFAGAAPLAQAQVLSDQQTQAIIDLLESFGAEPSTVTEVRSALTEVQKDAEGEQGNLLPSSCRQIGQFSENMGRGSRGTQVKCLQTFFNNHVEGIQVAKEGPGAPGEETSFFGQRTRAAVIDFQEKFQEDILAPYGLEQGTGFFSERTRAKANELMDRARNQQSGQEEEEEEDQGSSDNEDENEQEEADLTISRARGMESDLVLSGSKNVLVGSWEFSAAGQNLKVRDIPFDIGTTTSVNSISQVAISYTQQDDLQRIQSKQLQENGKVVFQDAEFFVPADGTATLKLFADFKTIAGGANSGDAVQFDLQTSGGFRMDTLGASSRFGEALRVTGDNLISPVQVVRGAIPSVELSKKVEGRLRNADNFELLRWEVGAETGQEHNNVSVKKFSARVDIQDNTTSTPLTVSSPKLSVLNGDRSPVAADVAFIQNGSATSTVSSKSTRSALLAVTLEDEITVASGQREVFALRADISGLERGDETQERLEVTLEAPDSDAADRPRTGPLVLHSLEGVQLRGEITEDVGGFLWSDNSAGSAHSDEIGNSSSDWTNGYLVQTLPPGSFTFSE